ncbi:hypothetical protein DB313_06300 (plasmid) [Borrelia turcica IST7]|uniref:Uncharacterized protein n=1 Tax=Borrelia turcica IST7 TaxID=1104446 RepID=A0A386PNS0_9SPIR|nr:hypothetical protein [Borrelia turcica]AYE37111.1 hypothetical protein DB313_06300 [Borrelia turcica IST7]
MVLLGAMMWLVAILKGFFKQVLLLLKGLASYLIRIVLVLVKALVVLFVYFKDISVSFYKRNSEFILMMFIVIVFFLAFLVVTYQGTFKEICRGFYGRIKCWGKDR